MVVLDQLYVGIQKLKKEISDERKEDSLCRLLQIEQLAMDTEIDITELLKRIKEELSSENSDTERLADMAEKLDAAVKTVYLWQMHKEETYEEAMIENVFSTGYEKNVLIAYILYPFLFGNDSPGHTNQVEAKIMAQTFSDLGYNVDIVNTRYKGTVNINKYQVVLGYGDFFDKICLQRQGDCKKIYYLTEKSPYFSNLAELKRWRYFQQRNGFLPDFERQNFVLLNLRAMAGADAAICIGNESTLETYENMFTEIYGINVTGFSEYQYNRIRKAPDCNKNFLWYGGAGAIHKGLDLCIEAFRSMPDLNLYIVGKPSKGFYDFYKKDIEEAENIAYYGFLNKSSMEYEEVCRQCAFCICPSCSESQSTAVITAMFSGMIPIATKEAGIDLHLSGGIEIEEATVENIINIVRSASTIPETELYKKMQEVYSYTENNHSTKQYKKRLRSILENILNKG